MALVLALLGRTWDPIDRDSISRCCVNDVVSGYLPADEVEHVALAYNTVYNLNLDRGTVIAAINDSRSVDLKHGHVNVDRFVTNLQFRH